MLLIMVFAVLLKIYTFGASQLEELQLDLKLGDSIQNLLVLGVWHDLLLLLQLSVSGEVPND